MKIKAYISLGGMQDDRTEEIEIDDADIEGMSDGDRDDYIYEEMKDALYQYIDMWYEIIAD